MLSPVHLRTLREVVRQGSFIGAANRLGYTPSAVSQQMAALESEVGVSLFDRSARSIEPNNSALVMAQHAEAVLSSMETMVTATKRSEGGHYVAKLSAYPSIAPRLVPRLIADEEFSQTSQELVVSLHDPSLAIQELRAQQRTDVSIVYRVGDSGLWWPDSYRPLLLGRDAFVVVAPTAWGLEAHVRELSDLADRPWILHHPNSSDAEIINELFSSRGVRPHVTGRSDDYAATTSLVSAGLGAAYVPEFIANDMPESVVVLPVDDIEMHRDVYALVSSLAPAARTQPLLAAIRRAMSDLGYAA